jgi:hypothetical protein
MSSSDGVKITMLATEACGGKVPGSNTGESAGYLVNSKPQAHRFLALKNAVELVEDSKHGISCTNKTTFHDEYDCRSYGWT